MTDFSDQFILVTGSTRGIGYAIAERLLDRGATVGIHGRSAEHVADAAGKLQPHGERVIAIDADFSDPCGGADAVARFLEEAGRIDGLVNNAGAGKARAFRAMTMEAWEETMRVNLGAAMTASREAYVAMRKQGTGSIVNIASIAGHRAAGWMGADYGASKAGLVSMTRSLALEAGRFGIRVNAVSPGFVETDMSSIIPDDMREKLTIPLGRFGSPDDVAGPVVFLLSADATYITGEILHVNGGLL
jgi:3-oxoacyl-[acyl-carrier protein] reductase